MAKQQVTIAGRERKLDVKRFASSLLGDTRARALSRHIDIARGSIDASLTVRGRVNRQYIEQFRNIHQGERCVIIGNGPSLRDTDMSLLRDEYTFGLNRLYLMFDDLGFCTTYHVVINNYVVEQCAEDFRRISSPLFTTKKNRRSLGDCANTGYLSNVTGPWFSTDATVGVWEGSTVTYVAMQLAYFMGFTEVILIGVDHRFAVTGKPNQLVESQGPDASHFDPKYFSKGFKWQLPDLERSELAYRLANDAYRRDGRKILDATVGGALEVFPKCALKQSLGK